MGLIKAIAGAAGGVMADQWKEFFTCEALPADVLAGKGHETVQEVQGVSLPLDEREVVASYLGRNV